MKKKETQPFKPYVTEEMIFAFDKSRPGTSTGSPLVDKVLELFGVAELRTATAMGRYLELDPRDISSYLLVATGHRLTSLRRVWTLHRLEVLRRSGRYDSEDSLAQALGFRDHSSLWHFLHAEEQDRKQNEHRHEIWSRVRRY